MAAPRGAEWGQPPPPGGPSTFRMGMPTPSVEPAPPELRLTDEEYVGAGRTIRGAPVLTPVRTENDYLLRRARRYGRGEMPTLGKRGLIRSKAGQDAAIREGERLLRIIKAYPDPELQEAEIEHLEKGLTQTGYCTGWQFPAGGLSPEKEPEEGVEECEQYFLDYLGRFASSARPDLAGLSYPRGKFKGYPFMTSDDAALPAAAAMGALIATPEDALEMGYRVARFLGDPSLLALQPWAIMFSRTGPLRKYQPYFSLQGGQMIITDMTKGNFCRRRHVNAVATYLNMASRPNAVRFKQLLRATPAFRIKTREERAATLAAARRRGLVVYSDDLSGYDKTFSARLYHSLLRVWRACAVEPETMGLYEWVSVDLGTIIPGYSDDKPAFVIAKHGGIPSGTVGTSSDGSGGNWMRTLKAVAFASGMSVARAYSGLLNKEWEGEFWGDDTILAIPPKHFDADKYTEMNRRLGLQSKISIAPVFLMTQYTPGRPPTNLASRTYVQSIWREHEQLNEVVGLLGLYIRFRLLWGHPLFSVTWRAVATAAEPDGVLLRRGVASWDDLVNLVASDEFRLELREALERDPAGYATLLESITRGTGDLGDNPEARFVESLLGGRLLNTRTWTPPSRIGLRGVDSAEKKRLLTWSLDNYRRLADERALTAAARLASREDVVDRLEDEEDDWNDE